MVRVVQYEEYCTLRLLGVDWEANGDSVSLAGQTNTVAMYDIANQAFGMNDIAMLSGGAGQVVFYDNATDLVVMGANTSAIVTGAGGVIAFTDNGDSVYANNETITTLASNQGESVIGVGNSIWESTNSNVSASGDSNIVNMTGANDVALLNGGSGYVVNGNVATDIVSVAANTSATVNGAGGTVLLQGDGDNLVASNMILVTVNDGQADNISGTGNVMVSAQDDMTAIYAAEGAAPPSAGEIAAFADAVWTNNDAPIELFSVDPLTGQQTVLADTSETNLLAELPVLEAEANGVNLGLQFADGTQMPLSTTDRVADFLYAVAAEKTGATQLLTDTYSLDMGWLNSIDQPLLNEAVQWSEQAANFAAAAAVKQGQLAPTAAVSQLIASTPQWGVADDNQLAAEYNTMSDLALKIAAQAPGNRQDMSVLIANPVKGNPTQITVYASGYGSSIHDTSPNPWTYVEEAISTVVNIAAVVTAQPELLAVAAAIDAAQAGQAFSNGQDVQGVLDLLQAGGFAAGSLQLGQLQTVLALAAQGAGGIYGVVTSAETGNGVGILTGLLEAAAASAGGLAFDSTTVADQAALSSISQLLSYAAIGTTFGNDLANGQLAQGLIDSLNGWLPNLVSASVNDTSNAVSKPNASQIVANQQYASNQTTQNDASSGNDTSVLIQIGNVATSVMGFISYVASSIVRPADAANVGSKSPPVDPGNVTVAYYLTADQIQAGATYLDNNTAVNASYTGSQGWCANYVANALRTEGLDLPLGSVGAAKNFGPDLLELGFHPVSLESYVPSIGDVGVVQPYPGATGDAVNGHVAMWDGSQWVSDYKQAPTYATGGGSTLETPVPGPTWAKLGATFQIYRP